MLNDPKERIKDRCPGCMNWGRHHVIEMATKLDACTLKIVRDSNIDKVAEDVQVSDKERVCSWSECSEYYIERPSNTLTGIIKRIFGVRRKTKRYCPMCGKKIKPEGFGSFCSMNCASLFMDEEETKKRRQEDDGRNDSV